MRYQNWQQDWKTLIASEAFRHDASAVASTSALDLDKVIASLDEATGFLGPAALRKLVGETIKDEEQVRGVASFIANMNTLQRHGGESFLAEFQRDFDAHANLTDPEKATIRDALPRMLLKRPPIERHSKADTLSQRLGAALHEFTITCDIRPVFDEKRDVVEGMFPVATLKVETYEGFIPVAVTARLSSKQLERIVEEAQNAQKKVTALRTLLTERQIYIPEAGAQADDDDEGEDDAT